MDCPHCSGTELEDLETEDGLAFGKCTECHKVWIDSGELSRALLRNRLPALDALGGRANLEEPAGDCPDDLTNLVVIEARRDEVGYAMCEICGGVWLDNEGRGFDAETADAVLAQILEFFNSYAAAGQS